MSHTERGKVIACWLLLSALAAGLAGLTWPAAHLGNEVIPAGMDAFYHARRIVDTAQDPASFYEFDQRIHAPEGSLLTWPWGYDYVMGQLVRVGQQLASVENPMSMLVWIPLAAVFASVGLIILIARRLGLSLWPTAIAGACVALSPLTQFLHGVGMIDHHWAEYVFVLLALATGLKSFNDLGSRKSAAMLGVVLGLAPAIHNSLFILQIPILAALFALWLKGQQLDRRVMLCFGGALLGATTLVLLPSLPFRLGLFEFYTLSWFHLYVAFASSVAAFLFAVLAPTWRGLMLLGVAAAALLAPLLSQLLIGQSFLGAATTRLADIYEARSLLRQIQEPNGVRNVTNLYSGFVLLLPITLALCLYRIWKERDAGRLFFWVFAAMGLSMLLSQFRFHHFGSFALYLPWLVMADSVLRTRPPQYKPVMLAVTLGTVLLYSYPLRHQLGAPWVPASDHAFSRLRPIMTTLRDACAAKPGVVLADNDAGHYVRYYTDCSVIANNFLLTPQHGRKVEEMDRLMSLRAAELPKAAPYVDYVLVRPLSIVSPRPGELKYIYHGGQAAGLANDLLLSPREAPRAQYTLMDEVVIPALQSAPYARLYEIDRRTTE